MPGSTISSGSQGALGHLASARWLSTMSTHLGGAAADALSTCISCTGRFRMTLDLHGSRRRWRRTVHSDDLTQSASRRDVTGLFPYSMNSRCGGGRGALFRRFTSTRIRNGLARRRRRRRRSPGFQITTRRTQNNIHGHGERRVVAHQYPILETPRDGKKPQ